MEKYFILKSGFEKYLSLLQRFVKVAFSHMLWNSDHQSSGKTTSNFCGFCFCIFVCLFVLMSTGSGFLCTIGRIVQVTDRIANTCETTNLYLLLFSLSPDFLSLHFCRFHSGTGQMLLLRQVSSSFYHRHHHQQQPSSSAYVCICV